MVVDDELSSEYVGANVSVSGSEIVGHSALESEPVGYGVSVGVPHPPSQHVVAPASVEDSVAEGSHATVELGAVVL